MLAWESENLDSNPGSAGYENLVKSLSLSELKLKTAITTPALQG